MHVFLEVERDVANYFDNEFWDEDYKEEKGKKDLT
jgi:hypothetical protein